MSDLLQHNVDNCTGKWAMVSFTTMTRKLKIKVTKRGHHLYCRECEAHYPYEGDYQRESWKLSQAERSVDRAMMEHEAVQAMAAEIRKVMDETTVPGSQESPEVLAEAALRGLRQRFFKVNRDIHAKSDWSYKTGDALRPVTDAIRAILDGAFSNWILSHILTPREGGHVRYIVELEKREIGQEAAVASRIESMELPPQYDRVEVTFTERRPS